MQKFTDGHDTDVGSSPPRLKSRFAAVPQPGAARACDAAGWPPAGELAPGSGGADDDPVHPVAAPVSRMDTQANASRSRPVIRLVATMPSLSVVLGGGGDVSAARRQRPTFQRHHTGTGYSFSKIFSIFSEAQSLRKRPSGLAENCVKAVGGPRMLLAPGYVEGKALAAPPRAICACCHRSRTRSAAGTAVVSG